MSETELMYWEDPEYRKDFSDKEREALAKKGHAMPDGSYPIEDAEDLANAIRAVGRGGSSHNAIRSHIIARAKALGLSGKIPDNWNSDGSLKAENDAETGAETRAQCPTCEGSGYINEGNRECPDCNGTGEVQRSAPKPSRRKARHRAVPLGPEVRHFSAQNLELRESQSGDEIIVRGSAIVYDTPYEVRDFQGAFQETMRPGCVSDVLERGVDCRFLINHDGLALARTQSGTLKLIDTPTSLDIEAHLDARQSIANDFAIAVRRGDMDQMSVGMIVGRDEWGESDDTETREVQALDDLLDVSGVTYPASPTTSIAIAQRMAAQMPVESRARLRQLEVAIRSGQMTQDEFAEMLGIMQGRTTRAGAALSAKNKGHVATVVQALRPLLQAAGLSLSDLDPDHDGDIDTVDPVPQREQITNGQEGNDNLPNGDPGRWSGEDGTMGGGPQGQGNGGPGNSDGTGARKGRSAASLRLQMALQERKIKV